MRWRWPGTTRRGWGSPLSLSWATCCDGVGGRVRRGAGEPAVRGRGLGAGARDRACMSRPAALFAGADGLDVIRRLIGRWPASAVPLVALEVGLDQADAGRCAGAAAGLSSVRAAARPRRARARGGRRAGESGSEAFERCMAVGGVAVFPADTVYGLACDPRQPGGGRAAVPLKRRQPGQALGGDVLRPVAGARRAAGAGDRTRDAVAQAAARRRSACCCRNPGGRFPLACGDDPGTLGLRVPAVPACWPASRWPVLQSSANQAGGPDPRRLADVPELMRRGADLVIDAGELPGTPSTVIDLRGLRGRRQLVGGARGGGR